MKELNGIILVFWREKGYLAAASSFAQTNRATRFLTLNNFKKIFADFHFKFI